MRRLVLLALQHRQNFWMLMCQQADGHDTARPDRQALATQKAYLAVATQAYRIHLDRFHHGTPVADQSAVHTQLGAAIAHYRNVGGGATHVGNDGVADATQGAGADDAGSRST